MKIRLLINGKCLTQRQTGAQRYAREILAGLDEITKSGEIIVAVPKSDKEMPVYKNLKLVTLSPLQGIAWEQITLPIYAIWKGKTILSLCNVASLIKPDICTIFDMKIRSHPQFYGWKFRLWYKLLFANQTSRSMRIFTDSEDAKREMMKYYPKTNPVKIHVAYASWEHFEKVRFDERTLIRYNLERGSYCFAMGSLEPNKNFRWVAEIAKRNPNIIFAIAGSLNSKVFSNGLGFDCPSNMKLLGFVSDEEAKTLMRDAKAFLFPSFCEGFGMPPLEALCAGCPKPVVSDIPVMHEVFEDNAIYIDPNEYNYNLENLLSNTACDAKSVLNRFSWKKSAEIIYKTITNI